MIGELLRTGHMSLPEAATQYKRASSYSRGIANRVQNGANLTWGKQLGLTENDGPPTETREIWIFAAINAVLYFSASILGCWMSDPLQSLILGRRGAIFFSGCLCLAGAIGCGFSQTWPQLLGCRLVLGAAMGAKASVTPIYGAEVSPPHLR
jgi:MFS family permease